MRTIYKVIEVSPVDEITLESAMNTWVSEGWTFERVEFVQQAGVRRPTLAYLFFFRGVPDASDIAADEEATADPDGESSE